MDPWLVRYIVPADTPLIGGQDLSIPSLFFMGTVGFMLALSVVIRGADRRELDARRMLDLSLVMLIGGLVGGRLGHVLMDKPRYYLDHPGALLDIWEGGLHLYSALLLAVAVGWLFMGRVGLARWRALDVLAPAISFMLVFTQIGCLSAGCGYGRPIDFPFGVELPWGVVFYGGQVPEILRGIYLHPTQIYEALVHLGLFVGLSRWRARAGFEGQIFFWWLGGYAAARVLVEFFRMDQAHGLWLGWVATAQLISLFCIVLSAIMLKRLGARARASGGR